MLSCRFAAHSLANIWSFFCRCFLDFVRFLSSLVLFSCSGFTGGNLVGFSTWVDFSACAQRGALGVSHKRFSTRFCGDLLGGFRSCVCVAFERRRVEFSTSLETGLNCHGIRFRRSLSTNLFLCVWEGRQMDGAVGSSDLNCADLAISSLLYLTCFSRLAIAIWKDDGRVKPEEALVVEVQGGACR